jgi:peptide/nickel transport system substrate-binding protein
MGWGDAVIVSPKTAETSTRKIPAPARSIRLWAKNKSITLVKNPDY